MIDYTLYSSHLDSYEKLVKDIFSAPLQQEISDQKKHKKIKPRLNYLICFTNRSGSTLLSNTLARTGLMGTPGEMFNPEPLTSARQKFGLNSFEDYLNFKIETSSKNRVFGAKVGTHHLAYLAQQGYLTTHVNKPKFIYVTRKNKVMQAISLYLAWETGAWTSKAPAIETMPVYNAKKIAQQLNSIISTEAQFEAFFAAHRIKPLRLHYEDLEKDLTHKVIQVCKFVGLEELNDIKIDPVLQKQRTPTNQAWAKQFVAEHRRSSFNRI